MNGRFDSSICKNLRAALSREWLETNGLGGYACSTIIGANTRRQHGLLVVPARPPLHRHVLLAKVEERVLVNSHESWLSTNLYPGTVFPHGFNIQTEFHAHPWPTFRYADADFEIEKTVTLIHGENTVVLAYRNVRARGPLELRVRPLLAYRDHNILRQRAENVNLAVAREGNVLSIQPREALPRLFFHARPDNVDVKADWYYRFTYPPEQERSDPFEEDLFTTCELAFRLPADGMVYLVVTTEPKLSAEPAALLARERQRREQLARDADPVRQDLLRVADAFVVRRGDGCSVLAGYPWHTDWGRVALVALPGLLLTTGRLDEAQRLLATFAGYADRGLLPNDFNELTNKPSYNSADAPLWFIVALWRWWKAGGDAATLLPSAREVVSQYRDGTKFDIYADKDGLLHAGEAGSQLTWMDVKVEGYIPTPRHGKPVEVNALWLNAVLMLAELEEHVARDVHAAVVLRKLGDQIAGQFVKTFWCAETGWLYDVVRGSERDSSLRPNQLFAVSLPFSPLTTDQQKSVLAAVTQHLLTPVGLRTLSPQHDRYCPKYTGNRRQRDCARHQGTVWPWLIGAYADAWLRVNGTGKAQRKELLRLLQPMLDQVRTTGGLAEMYDGAPPHRPAGAIASAWAVGELLRAYDACGR